MASQYDAVGRFAQAICHNISQNLDIRTNDFRLGDGFETTTNSVLSALLARQASLALGLAESPLTWNGHIAPPVLRSMVDLAITFRWILCRPHERALEYVNYGLGAEKLLVANYQKVLEEDEADNDLKSVAEMNLAWIESQQFHIFVEVNLGSWAGRSTRAMCKEIGDEDLYKFAFTPYSAAVHNMWNHVGKWNSRICQNAMHKRHSIGTIGDAWPVVDFLFRACKYFEMVISEFDSFYDFESEIISPTSAFENNIGPLVEAWKEEEVSR